MEDAFPLNLYDSIHGLKLESKLDEEGEINLSINGKDFIDYQFILLVDIEDKKLRGVVKFNKETYLAADETFEWKPLVAQNRYKSKLGNYCKFKSLSLSNIKCESGIL